MGWKRFWYVMNNLWVVIVLKSRMLLEAATSAHVEAFRPESPPLSEKGLMDDTVAPVYKDNRKAGIQLVRDWMEAMRSGRYNSLNSPTTTASNVIRPIIGATREDNFQFVGQWLVC
jgi:hypothetical protein